MIDHKMRRKYLLRDDNYHQVFMCMTGSTLEQIYNLNKLMGTDDEQRFAKYANLALSKTSDKFI